MHHGSLPAPVASGDQELHKKNCMLDFLKIHLRKAQANLKAFADKKRRDVNIQVGDLVYGRFQLYKTKSLATKKNEKLKPHFFGPYKVLEKIDPVPTKPHCMDLPLPCTIHPVIHVTQLYHVLGPDHRVKPLPGTHTASREWLVSPEALLEPMQASLTSCFLISTMWNKVAL